jgi:hypothetical protein
MHNLFRTYVYDLIDKLHVTNNGCCGQPIVPHQACQHTFHGLVTVTIQQWFVHTVKGARESTEACEQVNGIQYFWHHSIVYSYASKLKTYLVAAIQVACAPCLPSSHSQARLTSFSEATLQLLYTPQ